jgi:hypothetical protein
MASLLQSQNFSCEKEEEKRKGGWGESPLY